jgi:hypothetical protein
MSVEAQLKLMGLELPPLPEAGCNYIPSTLHNETLYLRGQGPILEDSSIATGIVGKDITIDEANIYARRAGTGSLPNSVPAEITAVFATKS